MQLLILKDNPGYSNLKQGTVLEVIETYWHHRCGKVYVTQGDSSNDIWLFDETAFNLKEVKLI